MAAGASIDVVAGITVVIDRGVTCASDGISSAPSAVAAGVACVSGTVPSFGTTGIGMFPVASGVHAVVAL